jgi:hypothetical protein
MTNRPTPGFAAPVNRPTVWLSWRHSAAAVRNTANRHLTLEVGVQPDALRDEADRNQLGELRLEAVEAIHDVSLWSIAACAANVDRPASPGEPTGPDVRRVACAPPDVTRRSLGRQP